MPRVHLWNYLWKLALLIVGIHTAFASSNGNGNGNRGFPLEGTTPDPFVEASMQRRGLAPGGSLGLLNQDEAYLLLSNQQDNGTTIDPPIDLPESYRGPFRIHSLEGSALVCAGWRTDGIGLAEHLLAAGRKETAVFGRPHRKLQNKASLFLANSYVSSKRPLACAGLLATCGKLYMVDATGAYAFRAYALGRGSSKANAILQSRDWNQLQSDAVVEDLWKLLLEDSTIVSKGSRFELALVDSEPSTQGTSMKRLFAKR
eukprot:CAMPEP_0116114076 /NCGR_PEP_ID=MMETSP0327-20121206/19834_1 /TAXON_ID=44447 /ORGANISM="Pseudo-nitzschia delicatissima, Strain B596" /LENGTH=258 /DNA_ID=CAMNT_0003607447 /DNA_START=31 /DNA_END=808 /DNA_ORIENTATION=+